MNKDPILAAIAAYLEARRVAAVGSTSALASVSIRAQKSVAPFPESGSIIVITADTIEHTIGPWHRLEPLRLRVQTAGLQSRDVASHVAAMDLCVDAFPDVESASFAEAWAAFGTALEAADVTPRFWWTQGQREQPVEDNAWWEDVLDVRVGLEEGAD